MDEARLLEYIEKKFPGVEVVIHEAGGVFFFYDPDRNTPPKLKMPFATLLNNDNYDRASNLSRPSIFRLNIGVSKDTYRSLLGDQPAFPENGGYVDTGHDFTTLDQIMPHPEYASASWICVLNPGDKTLKAVCGLLAEAYDLAVARYENR